MMRRSGEPSRTGAARLAAPTLILEIGMDADMLKLRYDELRAEAIRLAGDLLDIPRRVIVLYNLYLESGRNHAFSQIAAHGALWAHGYFEVGGRLGRFVARRYFYNSTERQFRLGLL